MTKYGRNLEFKVDIQGLLKESLVCVDRIESAANKLKGLEPEKINKMILKTYNKLLERFEDGSI